MATLRSLLLLSLLTLAFTACDTNGLTGPNDNGEPTEATNAEGFVGAWAAANWSDSGITGGTTTITGTADSLALSYNVNLDTRGGVSRRTAIFQVDVSTSGTVAFDWEYTGYHAFFRPFAELTARSGNASNVLVNNESTRSSFSFTGSTSIAVTQGQPLTFEMGGSNFDRDTRLRGTVTITNFRFTP